MIGRKHLQAAMLGVAMTLFLPLQEALAVKYTDYTVKDLLSPCVEGDADSRWGETFEINCNQYLRGFSDAYFHFATQSKLPKVCFADEANRLNLLRWAFIKWATNNTDKQDWPAAQGLVAAVNAEMKCP